MSSGRVTDPARARGRRHTVLAWLGYVATWLVFATLIGLAFFLGGSREVNVASHETELRPTLTGRVVVLSGPVLPDLRMDSGSRLGVEAVLGKTDARSTQALAERYALIASNPDGVRSTIRHAVTDMATDAAVRGALLGLLPVLGWVLVGPVRRRELVRDLLRTRDGIVVLASLVLLVLGLWRPWAPEGPDDERRWMPLSQFLAGVVVPAELRGIEISGDVLTGQTRRLLQSIVESYDRGREFYAAAAETAATLPLRQPAEDETVVALVSDRHDNIGMDAVARAVADAGGATAVFDAGDDTSTGSTWESFSLDSLDAAFEDFANLDGRWMVAGNHDHGDFVTDYLARLGWQVLDGEVVAGPGGSRLLGDSDPRSSGLGIWRDSGGRSFSDVAEDLADAACESEERVGTLLVHDANLGREALARGCVDLVLGGHVHTQVGPTAVEGSNGRRGYSFTTGTTGGAAYAIAVGSKIRRPAQVSLVTYRDGRPAGIQPVVLQTDGRFEVGEYVALALD